MPKDHHQLLSQLALLRWKIESMKGKQTDLTLEQYQKDLDEIYQDLLMIIREIQEVLH